MLREILWLDSGDTIIIRGTGTQIQYNCVTPNRTLFLDNVFQLSINMCRPFAPSWRVWLLSSRVTAAV